MIKKIFCGIAVIAGLTACNDDYTDWASPQSNAAKEAAERFEFTVESQVEGKTIDFATETATDIQLFTTNLQEGQTNEYTVTFTADTEGNDNVATLSVAMNGTVAVAELENAVTTVYGRAPEVRTLNVEVAADVTITTEDGSIVAEKKGAFKLIAKPNAPHISQNYYIVGGTLDWAASAASKEQKFNHSGADVYDDPVFSITIPAVQGDATWFAIGDDEACEAVGNGDWSKLLGTTSGNGNSGEAGSLAARSNLSDDGSFCVPVGAASIYVEINMMDYTYTVKAIYPCDYYYITGNPQGWSDSDKRCMFYAEGNNTYSYTTQWTGAWDLKIWDGNNFGDWSNCWGTAVDGDGSESGSLINANAQSFQAPAAGYYTLTINMQDYTYQWTAVTPSADYDQVSIIGDFNGWADDIYMEQISTAPHNWYVRALIPSDGGLKFRADPEWKTSWGTADTNTAIGDVYYLEPGDGNINVPAGTYDFYLNDITGRWNIVKVE